MDRRSNQHVLSDGDGSDESEDKVPGTEKSNKMSEPAVAMKAKNFKKLNEKKDKWVMLADESLLKVSADSDDSPIFVKLRHPKTEESSQYVFSDSNQRVYEVVSFKEAFRSWFIDQTVHHDGSLLLVSPVDGLFLILPYLMKAGQGGKFMPLDQIICENGDDYPECSRLCQCGAIADLESVSNKKGDDDLQVYRYSESKTLSWLKVKVERLAEKLEQKRVSSGTSAQSAMFVQSKKSSVYSKDDYMRYALGLISDYLPLELASTLQEFLAIPELTVQSPAEEPPSKKARLDGNLNPTEDYSIGQKKLNKTDKGSAKMTSGQKQLLKVDKTGMKSMASFFAPKAKR